MLKITTHTDTAATRLVLEGRLGGPWVQELECCWRKVAGPRQGQLLVDLTGVTFIDQEGKALLTRMRRQGVELRACGCLTKSIVDEITKAGCTGSSHPSQEDKG